MLTVAHQPMPQSQESFEDPIARAVGRLERSLPERADAKVLSDFLDDHLREGLEAVEGLQDHFLEVITALDEGEISPALMIDVGDPARALGHVERLISVLPELRRRLSRAAALMHQVPQTSRHPLRR